MNEQIVTQDDCPHDNVTFEQDSRPALTVYCPDCHKTIVIPFQLYAGGLADEAGIVAMNFGPRWGKQWEDIMSGKEPEP